MQRVADSKSNGSFSYLISFVLYILRITYPIAIKNIIVIIKSEFRSVPEFSEINLIGSQQNSLHKVSSHFGQEVNESGTPGHLKHWPLRAKYVDPAGHNSQPFGQGNSAMEPFYAYGIFLSPGSTLIVKQVPFSSFPKIVTNPPPPSPTIPYTSEFPPLADSSPLPLIDQALIYITPPPPPPQEFVQLTKFPFFPFADKNPSKVRIFQASIIIMPPPLPVITDPAPPLPLLNQFLLLYGLE